MKWIDVSNNPKKLLSYLQKLVNANNEPDIYEDGKQLKETWTKALINYLEEKLRVNTSNHSTV